MSDTPALPEPLLRATFESTIRKSWTAGYVCQRDNQGNYIEGTLRFAWYLVEECARAALAAQAEVLAAEVSECQERRSETIAMCEQLRADLARLTAERDALRVDAERIDWLESRWRDGLHLETCATNAGLTHHGLRQNAAIYDGALNDGEAIRGDTIRGAIDAARAQGGTE